MYDFEGDFAKHKKNVTSYEGEDGVLEYLFSLIGQGSKYCVEFGARDGKAGSNTYNLIANHGWSGLLIEADPADAEALHSNFQENNKVKTIIKMVTPDGDNKLDNILSEVGAPHEPDMVVIDIDSTDYLAFDSIKKFSPRVIMVEHNDTMPLWLDFYEQKDQPIHTGSSLRAQCRLAHEKGYKLIYSYKVNAIFVREDICETHGLSTFDVESLLSQKESLVTAYEGQVCFIAYDGSLVLLNLNKKSRLSHKKLESYAHWALQADRLIPVPIRRHSAIYKFVRKLIHQNENVYKFARFLHKNIHLTFT